MIAFFMKRKGVFSSKILSALIAGSVFVSTFAVYFSYSAYRVYAQAYTSDLLPSQLVTPSLKFERPFLKGIRLYSDAPFKFDFIIDKGSSRLDEGQLKTEVSKLIRYFLTSLTLSEDDLWVNLSPYEKDRIIPDKLTVTELGRDLLQQDYILKQLIASFTDPRSALGKKFWKRVYQRAKELYGTTQIPINTFNKVWIVPAKAEIYENKDKALIGQTYLKVFLEEDFIALKNAQNMNKTISINKTDHFSAQIMKEVVIPEIEKEVNYGKNFALLRQIYHSIILATWFKLKLRESLLSQVYANKGLMEGINVADKRSKEIIYGQYVQAYRQGGYSYIQKDFDLSKGGYIKKRYCSGGIVGKTGQALRSHDLAQYGMTAGILTTVKAGDHITTAALKPEQNKETGEEIQRFSEVAKQRRVKVLLIHPRAKTQKASPTRVPEGLMSIAAAVSDKEFLKTFCEEERKKQLQKKILAKEDLLFETLADYPDVEVKILDLQAHPENFQLEEYVKNFNPDLVGVTAVTNMIKPAQEIARKIKAVCPQALRIIGGVHVSSLPRETIEKSDFQIGVLGEGEETFAEIILNFYRGVKDWSKVEGIIFRKNDEIIQNNMRVPVVTDADLYPMPAKAIEQLINLSGYAHPVGKDGKEKPGLAGAIFTSRGCFQMCSFCASNVVFGRRIHHIRSAQAIFKEMLFMYKNYGTSLYFVLDDVFTFNKQRLRELAVLIEKSEMKGNIEFGCMTRADLFDEEIAQLLKRIGCSRVAFGVESGDPELLDNVISKTQNTGAFKDGAALLKAVKRARKICAEVGLGFQAFFMVGLPTQGWESVAESIDLMLELDPDFANISICMPYPKTRLYEEFRKPDDLSKVDPKKGWIKCPEDPEVYEHEPEPQLRDITFPPAPTETDAMDSEQISLARELMLKVFLNRKNPHERIMHLDHLRVLVRNERMVRGGASEDKSKTFLFGKKRPSIIDLIIAATKNDITRSNAEVVSVSYDSSLGGVSSQSSEGGAQVPGQIKDPSTKERASTPLLMKMFSRKKEKIVRYFDSDGKGKKILVNGPNPSGTIGPWEITDINIDAEDESEEHVVFKLDLKGIGKISDHVESEVAVKARRIQPKSEEYSLIQAIISRLYEEKKKLSDKEPYKNAIIQAMIGYYENMLTQGNICVTENEYVYKKIFYVIKEQGGKEKYIAEEKFIEEQRQGKFKEADIIRKVEKHISGFSGPNFMVLSKALLKAEHEALSKGQLPLAAFHESGEMLLAQNPVYCPIVNVENKPVRIVAHTFLRGCGKDVRSAFEKIEISSQETIAAIIEKLDAKLNELSKRKITQQEKAIIYHNYSLDRRGAALLYGIQDVLFNGENKLEKNLGGIIFPGNLNMEIKGQDVSLPAQTGSGSFFAIQGFSVEILSMEEIKDPFLVFAAIDR